VITTSLVGDGEEEIIEYPNGTAMFLTDESILYSSVKDAKAAFDKEYRSCLETDSEIDEAA